MVAAPMYLLWQCYVLRFDGGKYSGDHNRTFIMFGMAMIHIWNTPFEYHNLCNLLVWVWVFVAAASEV